MVIQWYALQGICKHKRNDKGADDVERSWCGITDYRCDTNMCPVALSNDRVSILVEQNGHIAQQIK